MGNEPIIELAKKAVCFYVIHNKTEWPTELKEKVLEIIEAEKERETEPFSIRKETRLDELYKDAIYFFQLEGAPETQEVDFAYLQEVIELGSRVIVILSDKAVYTYFMSLYGGAKNDRIHPYPDSTAMLRDLHFRLKDY